MGFPVKPLKVNTDTGEIQRFDDNDTLPNQPIVDDNRTLISLIVLEMVKMGLPVSDERLLNLLNNF